MLSLPFIPLGRFHVPHPTGKLSNVLEVHLCLQECSQNAQRVFSWAPSFLTSGNTSLCISFSSFPLSTIFLRFTHIAMCTVLHCLVINTMKHVSPRAFNALYAPRLSLPGPPFSLSSTRPLVLHTCCTWTGRTASTVSSEYD